MPYAMYHAREAKLAELRRQADEIKELVNDIVENAADRGENIDELRDRAHQLEVEIVPWP